MIISEIYLSNIVFRVRKRCWGCHILKNNIIERDKRGLFFHSLEADSVLVQIGKLEKMNIKYVNDVSSSEECFKLNVIYLICGFDKFRQRIEN